MPLQNKLRKQRGCKREKTRAFQSRVGFYEGLTPYKASEQNGIEREPSFYCWENKFSWTLLFSIIFSFTLSSSSSIVCLVGKGTKAKIRTRNLTYFVHTFFMIFLISLITPCSIPCQSSKSFTALKRK